MQTIEKSKKSSEDELCAKCGSTGEQMVELLRGGSTAEAVAPPGPARGRNKAALSRKARGKASQAKPVWGPVVEILLADCRKHPANREHSPEDVLARKASLQATGQLEPLKVKQLSNTEYLVLGGWGRVLAALAADWVRIEARVLVGMDRDGEPVPTTEAELLGLVAEDNSQRTDLTVFERATLGAALEEAGYSTREAARRVGLSDGGLSNAKRLLKLPPSLRQRILLPRDDEHYLPQATGREIADYVHIPEILAAIEKDLEEEHTEWREYPGDSLAHCVRQVVRPMDSEAVSAMAYHRDMPAAAQGLPTVQIPVRAGGEVCSVSVTTDVAGWEAAAKASDRSYTSADEPGDEQPKRGPTRTLTAEEKRLQAREKAEQLKRRRDRWEYGWRHRFVCRVLADDSTGDGYEAAVERLTAWAISESHSTARQKLAQEIQTAGHKRGLASSYASADDCLGHVPAKSLTLSTIRRGLVRAVLEDTATWNPDFHHVPSHLVWQLCGDLDFDAAVEWRRLYEDDGGTVLLGLLWNVHEIDALAKLAKAAGAVPASQKKVALVDALIGCRLELPDWLRPQEKKSRNHR